MKWRKLSNAEETFTNRWFPLWLQWIIGGLSLLGAAWILANVIVEAKRLL